MHFSTFSLIVNQGGGAPWFVDVSKCIEFELTPIYVLFMICKKMKQSVTLQSNTVKTIKVKKMLWIIFFVLFIAFRLHKNKTFILEKVYFLTFQRATLCTFLCVLPYYPENKPGLFQIFFLYFRGLRCLTTVIFTFPQKISAYFRCRLILGVIRYI